MALVGDNFDGRVVMNREDQERLNWMLDKCHWVNAFRPQILNRLAYPIPLNDIPGTGAGEQTVLAGRVTAVFGDGAAATYNAISNDGTVSVTAQTPLQRPFSPGAIIEGAVNDACELIKYKNANDIVTNMLSIVYSEKADWAQCADEPPAFNAAIGPEQSVAKLNGYSEQEEADMVWS